MPEWTKVNLQSMLSGTETNVQVKHMTELRAPQQIEQPAAKPAPPPANANPTGAGPAPTAAAPPAKIRFEPQNLSLKPGQTATVGVVVENVNDLFSIPMLVQYNPAVVSIEEIQHGAFLSGGTQEVAIVSQPFKEKGQYVISATRNANTPGVNGTGTLLGLVVKALSPGSANLSIVQVSAKDSQQRAIPLVTGEATLQVQP